MATFNDVPTEDLVDAVAERLASELEEPDWATHAKSGPARDLPPEQEDFWTRRGASLLRKVAVHGPIGVERLRTIYGDAAQGSTRYRTRPNAKQDASGKIVRTLLQQLEDAGHVTTREGHGREVTGRGHALLDETAEELIEELDRPELERYA